MSHIFQDKGDVSIFFALCLIMFTELFYGQITMAMENKEENREWYNTVSKRIKGMPTPIVFPIVWTILFIGILIGMFFYYRNETFPNNGYMIDTITLIFGANVILLKTWPYLFFKMRQTILSLISIIIIILCSGFMTALFRVWELWGPMLPFLFLTLWSCYALYLNATWIYVETYLLRTIN